MLIELFQEVHYVAEFLGPDGLVLLNRGVVSGKHADGLQVLSLGEDGLIIEFRDFVRPLSALSALQEAAAKYLAGLRG